VIEDGLFDTQRARVLKLAYKAGLATMYANKVFVDEGGLMSYGPSVGGLFRESAGYVDKILRGAKPGDLAIEQPAKLELAVNLKTAKALAVTIPESILVRADQVIR
jgi:putative ABC transport system substrate-binding protein